MKTRLLITIAVFLVTIPWFRGLEFGMNNQVMADGITISAIIVMTITIVFSIISWFLFSWASRNIKFIGIPLSVIAGASLVIPFLQVLGPMTGVIVGVIAGFASFMIQKKIVDSTQNTSLVIAAITIVVTYFVLTLMILAVQTPSHIWNTGDGIGAWTGTAQGIEEKGFDNIFNNNIEFSYFLALIPSLIITVLIIQDKIIKSKFLIVLGSIFVLSVLLYVFVMGAIGQCDLPLILCTNFYESNLGGGSIDMDPDLSPSYALDFAFSWNSIFVFIPLVSGIIATILLSIHFILKRKNIPSRPYLALILAGILLFFTIPNFVSSLEFIPYLVSHPEQIRSYIFEQIVFRMWWQIVMLTIVGILLYRSSVIRKLIKK